MKSPVLPTVKVKGGPRGFRRINKSTYDADPESFELFTEDDQVELERTTPQVDPGFVLEELVSKTALRSLTDAGLADPVAILRATDEELEALDGVGAKTVENLRAEAAKHVTLPDDGEGDTDDEEGEDE